MSNTYTPGPWRVKANAAKILIEQTDEEGRWGLFVADCSMLDEGLANARLIATAPEMLERLLALDAWSNGSQQQVWLDARAIIAKATGSDKNG